MCLLPNSQFRKMEHDDMKNVVANYNLTIQLALM